MTERYFAKVENDIVSQVIVADSEFIQTLEGVWLECGNDSGRNPASTGYLYIAEKDNFAPQKPFESWILDDNCFWMPPIPYPDDATEYIGYIWNEEFLSWEIVFNIEQ